jgi:hypothetical protein
MVRLGIKDLRHRIGHRYGEKKGKMIERRNTLRCANRINQKLLKRK